MRESFCFVVANYWSFAPACSSAGAHYVYCCSALFFMCSFTQDNNICTGSSMFQVTFAN